MLHTVATSKEQSARLDEKLKRELGEVVLGALSDDRTEDIVLNPNSKLWVNRQGEGWRHAGNFSPTQAHAAIATVAAHKELWSTTTARFWRPSFQSTVRDLKRSCHLSLPLRYSQCGYDRAGFTRW